MDLHQKFNRLQYSDVMPSPALADIHEAAQAGPLLLDVADELAMYLADSLIAAEESWEMVNAGNWHDATREAVVHAYVVELIERFVSGAPDTAAHLRGSSIAALAAFVANQTDIAYYHSDGA